MIKPVRPDAAADAEIRAEIRWYEEQSAGLGQELWDEIQRVIALIVEHPRIGSAVPDVKTKPTSRRVRLRRFPFYVVYRERPADIQLIALAAMSRKPGYWIQRQR